MDRLIPASGGDGPQNGVPVGPPSRSVQAAQHRLVAGQLPRPLHLPGHPVYQGVEPVDADRQLGEPLIRQVPPAVVGQLVEEHEAKILLRQFGRWQYHAGLPDAQQHGGRRQGVHVQLHGPLHAGLRPDPRRQVQQRRVLHRHPPRPEIPQEALIGGRLPDQQRQRSRQPDHPEVFPDRRPQLQGIVKLRCGLPWRPGLHILLLRLRKGQGGGGPWLRRPDPRRGFQPPDRQQQPRDDQQPDIVLPPPADPLPHQRPEQHQKQDEDRPRQGQGENPFQQFAHGSFPSLSQKRFSSLYSSSESISP